MDQIKQTILEEIDNRIGKLYVHRDDVKPDNGNQFEQLNHAISDVIGASLSKELESLRSFVEEL